MRALQRVNEKLFIISSPSARLKAELNFHCVQRKKKRITLNCSFLWPVSSLAAVMDPSGLAAPIAIAIAPTRVNGSGAIKVMRVVDVRVLVLLLLLSGPPRERASGPHTFAIRCRRPDAMRFDDRHINHAHTIANECTQDTCRMGFRTPYVCVCVCCVLVAGFMCAMGYGGRSHGARNFSRIRASDKTYNETKQ